MKLDSACCACHRALDNAIERKCASYGLRVSSVSGKTLEFVGQQRSSSFANAVEVGWFRVRECFEGRRGGKRNLHRELDYGVDRQDSIPRSSVLRYLAPR